MASDPSNSPDLLRNLELRLAKIEALLGIQPPVPPTGPPLEDDLAELRRQLAAASAAEPAAEPAARVQPESTPAVMPDQPAVPAPTATIADASEPLPATRDAPPTRPSNPSAAGPRAGPRLAPPTAADLERMIGGRWFAAAGAVVVVIGVGLFLKLAYDRGWLNLIPPAGKCLSGAGFGLLLLGAGEVIRRKFGPLASAGVSAAGLGALFASVYAAFGVYRLIGPLPALVLLAGVCGLGFVASALGRLVSIAVVSLLAAYLSPMIIGEARDAPLVMPIYLFAVLSLGLGLSALREVPFRILRGLVWWGTLLLGTLWAIRDGVTSPGAAFTFLTACWAALHVELAVSASRGTPRARGRTPLELPWPAARFVATSFSTTAWSVGLAVHVLRRGTTVDDWIAPAIGTAVAAAVAAALAGRLRVLRDVPRTDSERLGAGLAMQAGGLLMAAVALGLSGWMESAAWLALGVSAVGAGRWIRSRGLDVYGLVALSVATGRLLFVDSAIMTPTYQIAAFQGLIVSRWMLVMVTGAAAWAGASLLLRRDGPAIGSAARAGFWTPLARSLLIVAMSHLNVSLLTPGADALSVAAAWLALGLAGLALARCLNSAGLAGYGVFVLVAATLRFFVDAPLLRTPYDDPRPVAGLVINRWTGLMLGGALAWAAAGALAPAWRGTPLWRGLRAAGLVAAMSMVSLSLVHPGADAGAVCIVWLVLGIAGLTFGRQMRSIAMTGYGLVMVAGATLRFLFASPITGAHAPALAEGLGLVLTRWALLMLGSAAAWWAAAAIIRDTPPVRGEGPQPLQPRTALVGVGLATVYTALADPRAEAGSLAMAWMVVAAAAILVHRVLPRVALDLGGLVGLTLAAAAWGAEYPAQWMRSSAPLLLHPGFWSSLALVGTAVGSLVWLRRARPTSGEVLKAIPPAALCLLLVSTSLEVARVAGILASDPTVRKAAVSTWWGIFAVALIVAGFARGVAPARRLGLALLSIATAKALAYDLREVVGLWRVVSVVGLGLLMLGVAVGYARVASKLAPKHPDRA